MLQCVFEYPAYGKDEVLVDEHLLLDDTLEEGEIFRVKGLEYRILKQVPEFPETEVIGHIEPFTVALFLGEQHLVLIQVIQCLKESKCDGFARVVQRVAHVG